MLPTLAKGGRVRGRIRAGSEERTSDRVRARPALHAGLCWLRSQGPSSVKVPNSVSADATVGVYRRIDPVRTGERVGAIPIALVRPRS